MRSYAVWPVDGDSGSRGRPGALFQEGSCENGGVLQVPALEFEEEGAAEEHLQSEIPQLGRHANAPHRAMRA